MNRSHLMLLMTATVTAMRKVAADVGPQHSWWWTIHDLESIIRNHPDNLPTVPPGSALDTIRRHADTHRVLASSDAYSAQEVERLDRALLQVMELIDADLELNAAEADAERIGLAYPPTSGAAHARERTQVMLRLAKAVVRREQALKDIQ